MTRQQCQTRCDGPMLVEAGHDYTADAGRNKRLIYQFDRTEDNIRSDRMAVAPSPVQSGTHAAFRGHRQLDGPRRHAGRPRPSMVPNART